MCKVLTMAGIKKPENTLDFLWVVQKYMADRDKDGIGYIAVKENGDRFMEKWLDPKDVFAGNPIKEDVVQLPDKVIERIGALIDVPYEVPKKKEEPKYMFSGQVDDSFKSVSAITLHTRMATCAKNLENVHPFIRDNVTLIHNGIINNHTSFQKKVSTCDSEAILDLYLKHDIVNNLADISKVTTKLEGYYAACLTARDKDNRVYIDVMKHEQANLGAMYIDELDCIVFCTTESILRSTLKDLDWNNTNKYYDLKDNHIARYDAITGDIIAFKNFNVKKKSNDTTKHGKSGTGHGTGTNSPSKNYTNWYNNQKQCLLLQFYQSIEEDVGSVDIPPDDYSEVDDVVNAICNYDGVASDSKYYRNENDDDEVNKAALEQAM